MKTNNFKQLVRNLRLKKHEKIEIAQYEDTLPKGESREKD